MTQANESVPCRGCGGEEGRKCFIEVTPNGVKAYQVVHHLCETCQEVTQSLVRAACSRSNEEARV